VTELALPSPVLPAPALATARAASGVIPAIVADAGRRAARRFLEFFAGTLENAQMMAAHESPRTTKRYDRTGDKIALDEVEQIVL
jgi:hypothetical protein